MSKKEDLKKSELSLDELEQASGGKVISRTVKKQKYGKTGEYGEIMGHRYKKSGWIDYDADVYDVTDKAGNVLKTFEDRGKADSYNAFLIDEGIIDQ